MKAKIGDYFMLPLPTFPKTIPFRVVDVYEHFAVLENILYPSEYGFSRPFKMCAKPIELSNRVSRDMVIRWVEKSSHTLQARKNARNGDPFSCRVLEKWEDYKDTIL